MGVAIKQPNEQLHEILKNGYIEVGDFLKQIIFFYQNVPNKDQYYIKMMNKYGYIDSGQHSEMVRLDKIISKNYAEWYLHCERDNPYITQQPDVLDLYHSLNIYGNKRMTNGKISMDTDNIEKLIGLMIDIDTEQSIFSNMESQALYEFLVDESIIGGSIPFVNAIVHSGAGLHLIIKFKYPVTATDKSKTLVKNMQNCFTNIIREQLVIREKKKLKVDTLSLTTSTRINTSYNSKNFNKVKFSIVNEELQELRELQKFFDEVKPYSRKKNKQKVVQLGMAKSARQARKTYVMLEDRKNDIKKLQQTYPEVCMNNEEKMCFLFCNFTVQQKIHNYIDTTIKNEEIKFEDLEITRETKEIFFREAFEETVEFNSNFEKPYKPRQLRSKMNILSRKNYKFLTETIIYWLDIPENVQWDLKTIASKEVVEAREKARNKKNAAIRKAERRNENGLTKKQQELHDLKITILNMQKEEPGISNREIGRRLGISESKVRTTLKK